MTFVNNDQPWAMGENMFTTSTRRYNPFQGDVKHSFKDVYAPQGSPPISVGSIVVATFNSLSSFYSYRSQLEGFTYKALEGLVPREHGELPWRKYDVFLITSIDEYDCGSAICLSTDDLEKREQRIPLVFVTKIENFVNVLNGKLPLFDQNNATATAIYSNLCLLGETTRTRRKSRDATQQTRARSCPPRSRQMYSPNTNSRHIGTSTHKSLWNRVRGDVKKYIDS